MILTNKQKALVCEKFGMTPQTSSDYQALTDDIFKKTRKTLGINTVKRLFGMKDLNTQITTLDIIAEYVGYENWEALSACSCNMNSSFSTSPKSLITNFLETGSTITVKYYPDREVEFLHLGNSKFKVVKTKSGKLQVGDEMIINDIVCNYTFVAHNVTREGKDLGEYYGGAEKGVSSFSIQKPKED
jgi:hypothetical protein